MSTEIDGVNGILKIEDAGTGAGAKLNLTSTDTSGASGEFLGIINFVSSDSSTGSAGTQAAIKGVYEDNGDSSGLEFFTGNSTGSGTPTLQKRMQIFHDSGVTITTADNTDTLTLTSTDADAAVGPNLKLYRNSGSPADNDSLGQIFFVGRNDNSQDFTAFQMNAYSTDVSDGTEDGTFRMYAMQAGSQHIVMQITPTETVFNDGSVDQDFRVESNSNANMLVVDGGNNKVGIGTDGPTQNLEINVDSSSAIPTNEAIGSTNSGAAKGLGIHNINGSAVYSGIALETRTSGASRWLIANEWQSTYNGDLVFRNRNGASTSTEVMRLTSGGIAIGGTGAANTLDDYEEGTWTVPNGAVNGITYAVASVAGNTYTKIGRQVTINAQVTFGGHTADGNATYLGTLPFTPLSGGVFVGKVQSTADITGCCVEINGGESFIRLMKDSGGTYDYVSRAESANQTFAFTISYLV